MAEGRLGAEAIGGSREFLIWLAVKSSHILTLPVCILVSLGLTVVDVIDFIRAVRTGVALIGLPDDELLLGVDALLAQIVVH